jgi:hypothetical protein
VTLTVSRRDKPLEGDHVRSRAAQSSPNETDEQSALGASCARPFRRNLVMRFTRVIDQADQECSAATKSFIDMWHQELQTLVDAACAIIELCAGSGRELFARDVTAACFELRDLGQRDDRHRHKRQYEK